MIVKVQTIAGVPGPSFPFEIALDSFSPVAVFRASSSFLATGLRVFVAFFEFAASGLLTPLLCFPTDVFSRDDKLALVKIPLVLGTLGSFGSFGNLRPPPNGLSLEGGWKKSSHPSTLVRLDVNKRIKTAFHTLLIISLQ
jgi:hypothetical protein